MVWQILKPKHTGTLRKELGIDKNTTMEAGKIVIITRVEAGRNKTTTTQRQTKEDIQLIAWSMTNKTIKDRLHIILIRVAVWQGDECQMRSKN